MSIYFYIQFKPVKTKRLAHLEYLKKKSVWCYFVLWTSYRMLVLSETRAASSGGFPPIGELRTILIFDDEPCKRAEAGCGVRRKRAVVGRGRCSLNFNRTLSTVMADQFAKTRRTYWLRKHTSLLPSDTSYLTLHLIVVSHDRINNF